MVSPDNGFVCPWAGSCSATAGHPDPAEAFGPFPAPGPAAEGRGDSQARLHSRCGTDLGRDGAGTLSPHCTKTPQGKTTASISCVEREKEETAEGFPYLAVPRLVMVAPPHFHLQLNFPLALTNLPRPLCCLSPVLAQPGQGFFP